MLHQMRNLQNCRTCASPGVLCKIDQAEPQEGLLTVIIALYFHRFDSLGAQLDDVRQWVPAELATQLASALQDCRPLLFADSAAAAAAATSCSVSESTNIAAGQSRADMS